MRDVDPGDEQDARRCPRAPPRPGRSPRSPPVGTTGCPGRNGARCAATPIGPMPGPPPPCGMQKVLCRLRWQTSAPIVAGPAEADLGVHVGAVHVDLAAVLVDDPADLLDVLLEHAVRGGVGDHQRGELVLVLPRPWPRRSSRSTLPLLVAGDRRRPCSPAITARGRVGAVRRDGDQADVAVPLAARFVVGADHEQARVFALRAGVGLQRDARRSR